MRTIWIALVGLVAIAIYAGALIVVHSGDPGFYYEYHRAGVLPEYPTTAVIESLAAMAVEIVAVALLLLLARRTKPWLRLLATTTCAAALFAAGLPLAMHSPPYYGGHLLWLFYAAGWLLAMTVGAAIEARLRANAAAR